MVRTTGVDMIMQAQSCTAREAVAFARKAVLGLSDECFSETVQLGKNSKADVYGKIIDGLPWYIKLKDDEDEGVVVISCHLPDHDIRTRGGVVSCTARPGRGK